MGRHGRKGVRGALAGVVALSLLGACASPGARPWSPTAVPPASGIAASPAGATSPAAATVRAGIAELVLTDRAWPTFEQARAHAVRSARDGTPLFAHVRGSRALAAFALPADPDGRYAFSAHPRLLLQIGDDQRLASLDDCYVTLTPADLQASELVVPLAPPQQRPGGLATDCWLAAAARLAPARHALEVRLAGFAGRYDGWLAERELLAVAPIAVDYRDGTDRYADLMRVPAAPVSADVAGTQGTQGTQDPQQALQALQAQDAHDAASTLRAIDETALRVPEPAAAAAAVDDSVAASPPTVPPLQEPASAQESSAPVLPAPSPPPRPATDAPVGFAAQTRVVIHHPASDDGSAARAQALAAQLAAERDWRVEIRRVPQAVSRDNIRVFFEADRAAARDARALVADEAMPIRDFSDYRPLPRPGTIEIWLAVPPSAGSGGAAPGG